MFFHRWHPQLFLRYSPIVDYLKILPHYRQLSILEVGSGSLGIGPYLKREFVGIDVDFSGPNWPQMTKIIATGRALPFQDKSFDIVICTDTLEHVPPLFRRQFVFELIRIARSHLILAFPAGKLAAKQDRDLDQLYRRRFGQPFPFLTEHLRYELPQVNQVKSWLNSPQMRVITTHNLQLRQWFMSGWMTKNFLIDFFFRKVLLLFLPVLKLLDQPSPHYRTYIFAKINS